MIGRTIKLPPRLLVRLWADRRGSNAVEFAFAVPILIWIVMGVVDIGRAIHYHQAMTEGTRAGVRYLTRLADPCSAAALQAAVGLVVTRSLDWSGPPLFPDWPADYAAASSSTTFRVTRTGCDANTGALAGNTLDMEVQYDFNMMIFSGGHVTLHARHQEQYIGL